jgi:glycosyltransferase involved in cell wall biosynthesis
MGSKVAGVIVARNEDEHIRDTITGIINQTTAIEPIILVDDGSTDRTRDIALGFRGIQIVSLPPHSESYLGGPELAERWNIGLNKARESSPNYILILGGDHRIEPNYVEGILKHMSSELVVACGRYKDQIFSNRLPGGSGRIVDARWWMGINGMQFPVEYGWEIWLVYRALMDGKRAECVTEVITVTRPANYSPKKSQNLGKGMYSLGVHPIQAYRRIFALMLQKPRAGISMAHGYVLHEGAKKLDVAPFVRKMNKERIKTWLKKVIGI